ncbi:putative cytochrome p450 [Cryphonectria parasitica EP155]|uniref:Cytochrome p450 n=1 Tax=Cryphonectria parasitica (strain ATCC 38755 / EP155) TaxID=660469 RepID=A0A9P4XTC5_CRYP1|nr:putative cytochrome p450 [Cryphonectria parasitica EP155]KAF3760405.1 putative cytochrome p450 [Cryphonectria parasitica EP155]
MATHSSSSYMDNLLKPGLLITQDGGALSRALLFTFLAWAIWGAWRFIVGPKLYSDDPEELPYFVPVLGHGLAFFRDSNGLFSRAREYFGGRDDPFALTIFGQKVYVVTNAKQSAVVYKDTESLSFEEFVQTLMRTNGSSEETIKKVSLPLQIGKAGFPNPDGLSLIGLSERMHVHQLHPGENLTVLRRKVLDWINRQLSFDVLAKSCTYASSQGENHLQLPLYKWTSDYFVRLGQFVYFGDVLGQIDPNYPDAYITFDEVVWKMLYQYPSFLCGDMTGPRDQMMASMTAYFQLPPAQRREQAAWIINAMEDEMRAIGVDDANIAIMIFHLYFAINTNARRTSFWMLTHLLRNPAYLEIFRAETAPAFRGDEFVDLDYIQDPAKCPQVNAIWHETLRVAGWAGSVRLVTRDLVLGGKRLRKGNRVLVPHRLGHFDESIFGGDVNSWLPQRWLDNDRGKRLQTSPSWRPFGAGKTICSGRYLAKFFVTAFVATLLRRFDIKMVENSPMPEADVGRPVVGIIGVKEGHDILVSITKRKVDHVPEPTN